MRRFYLSIAMLFGGAELCAQNITTEPLWIQYMLEPRPNYNKVKQAFTDYWKDSIPSRGHGYKVFKRWEWRALQHLDQNGDVVWPQQQLNDFIGQNQQGPSPGSNSQ